MITIAGSSALRIFTPHAERAMVATRKAGSQAPWGPVFFFAVPWLGIAVFRAAARSAHGQARARLPALGCERQRPGEKGQRQGSAAVPATRARQGMVAYRKDM